jgi:hypothetical protein
MKQYLIVIVSILGFQASIFAQQSGAYSFSDIGNNFSFTGTIYGTPDSGNPGEFTFTSGSATFSQNSDLFAGLTATLVPNPNAPYTLNSGFDVTYDDQGYPNQTPALDRAGGLLFSLNSNGVEYYINPYDLNSTPITFIASNGHAISYPTQETVIQDYGQNVLVSKSITITSLTASPATPTPPLAMCLAFAGALVLQALRKKRVA